MADEIVLLRTPDAAALFVRRQSLAALRELLVEREGEFARVRGVLAKFEGRYLRVVGVLYAELDDLEARIAEREVDLYDSVTARQRAEESRRRARETHEAAYSVGHEVLEFDPPTSLKTLFRDVAKRIHPDYARDEGERRHFTLLMACANQAYRRGDTGALQRLLDDDREVNATVEGVGDTAEMLRIGRQIRHAERDLTALHREWDALMAGEIGQLWLDAEAAAVEHRDLLAELASGLQEQIAGARYRWEFTERQVSAHGR